jgi:hypothetical protein
MTKWTMLLAVCALLVLPACGGNATPQPTQAPAATAAPVATSTIAPTPTAAATATAAATDTPAPSPTAAAEPGAQTNFAPKVRSVWNTAVGLDQMTGTCSQGSVLPVYGLVQITPAGDDLTWKSQEPKPYTLKRLAVNQYEYSGPTSIDDGVVTMTLKFSSDKALEMLRVFVSKADPACTHTHEYTGTFQWERP